MSASKEGSMKLPEMYFFNKNWDFEKSGQLLKLHFSCPYFLQNKIATPSKLNTESWKLNKYLKYVIKKANLYIRKFKFKLKVLK